jgi:sigma-E factor negative regulatory protein RseB
VDPRALENYEWRAEGAARVAGRDAAVFLLEPRDALRFAQRLWADRATGLMLRADVLDPAGQLLESTAFSEVEIGVRPQPETVLQTLRKLDAPGAAPKLDGQEGWRVLRPPQRRAQLEAEGWTLRQQVPGFVLAGCMVKTLEASAGPTSVLQAVFSDGLSHVSLFIEPYRAERHRQPAQSQVGATGALSRRHGEHWITAVGDVPAATLKQFADALERRR